MGAGLDLLKPHAGGTPHTENTPRGVSVNLARVRLLTSGGRFTSKGAEAPIHMVGAAGFEPARLSAEDFKSPASANSATPP